MIVRGGYGIYYDNPVYQSIATQMAQQSPLSTSLRVQNSPDNPLTLANGFRGSPNILNTTFAVDPHFRTGYAQNWQLSVQRDLPFALRWSRPIWASKARARAAVPAEHLSRRRAVNPCPACPSGFSYHDVERQLHPPGRHLPVAPPPAPRLHLPRCNTPGPKPSMMPPSAAAGFLIAQNWLDLSAERGRSNFDQRHLVTFQTQYTTGAGSGGFLSYRPHRQLSSANGPSSPSSITAPDCRSLRPPSRPSAAPASPAASAPTTPAPIPMPRPPDCT